MGRNAILAALLALSAAACQRRPGRDAQSAADWFVDKLYVEVLPDEAVTITTGTAEAAVKELIRLRREAGGGGSFERPRVYWERAGEPSGNGERTLYRYRLRVESGGVAIQKEVAVEVASAQGAFKVSNYSERDEPAVRR
jgi:hypothetical protein